MVLRVLAGVVAFGFFGSLQAQACEAGFSERPSLRQAEKLRALLAAERFDELERIARESLEPNARLSDGQPQRTAFSAMVDVDEARCSKPSFDPDIVKGFPLLRSKLDAWKKARPRSHLAAIMDASYYTNLAWAVRGIGHAPTVVPKAWGGFAENIETARRKLDAIRGDGRKDPLWYEARLGVATTQGMREPEFRKLMKEGLARNPGYLPLHFRVVQYFQPQWHGSPEKLKAIVNRLVDENRILDKDVLYARLWWSGGDHDLFLSGDADWARVKKGFEILVREYPDDWNLNNFAKMACYSSDRETLRLLLARLEKPMIEAWGDARFFEFCSSMATPAMVDPKPAPR